MGFFSSRKDDYSHSHFTSTNDKPKVVQVIRSRFYGKAKGKERDEPEVSFSSTPSAAQALSPLARRPTAVRHVQRPATTYETTSISTNGRPATVYHLDHSPPSSHTTSPSARFLEPSNPKTSRPPQSMSAESSVKTDAVTVTLAQRLDELAKANSEGLLNDEEYRMLRKDLFERFASTSSIPMEPAVVPTARQARARTGTGASTSSIAPSRPSSQFHVNTTRTPSIRSKGSMSSGMASFFSRITDTRPRSNSKDHSDVSSIFSSRSNLSNTFRLPRLLTRKTSQSSVGTEVSQSQADAISITSRRTDRSHGDRLAHFSPNVTRSTTLSVRRMATPPSAFPSRIGPTDTHANPLVGVTNIFDEENLTNSQDIRKEILAVEAEKRRLMDSFNSLELRVLTQQRRSVHHTLYDREEFGDAASSHGSVRFVDRGGGLRRKALENDATSIRSGLSTSPSIAKSTVSWKPRSIRTGIGPPSVSDSLSRKNSKRTLEEPPPVPTIPSKTSGYLGVPSGNASAGAADSTSFLTLDTLPEDEPPSITDEMDDIKRRREEVAARYDARLHYLQAKLKGAQLHEKLLRK